MPSTNASGKKVIFTQQDLERIAAMLEAPGLYKFSYENKARRQRRNGYPMLPFGWLPVRILRAPSSSFGTIVLDLFKYYGQTVVNFKSNCNAAAKKENIYDIINYSNKDSVFTITKGEAKAAVRKDQPGRVPGQQQLLQGHRLRQRRKELQKGGRRGAKESPGYGTGLLY